MRYIIPFILFIFSSFSIKAQSFNGIVNPTATVSTLLSVTLSNNTGTASFTNMNAYVNGITTNNFSTLAIKSNVLWLLSVSAQSTNFAAMGGGASSNMPASVVSMRLSNTSTFYPLSTAGFTLKTGGRGNNLAAGNTFGIDMRFNPGFSYPGGIYSLGLMYTLTNQ